VAPVALQLVFSVASDMLSYKIYQYFVISIHMGYFDNCLILFTAIRRAFGRLAEA